MSIIKKYMKSVLALLALLVLPLNASADEAYELLVTIKTNLYESDGESNSISIAFGSTEKNTYIDIDGGFGTEEFEVGVASLDSEGVLGGSLYEGKVSKDGVLKVYGDPSKIDYINASGNEITEIIFNDKLNLEILNVEHNSLKSLNVDKMQNLKIIYMEDNAFTKETPLMIGYLPNLVILEMANVEWISDNFTLKNFPNLTSFDAYHSTKFKYCDTSACPNLVRLSVEMTQVSELDLSNNPYLSVLNINESRVKSIDLSKTPKLQELYISHVGALNRDIQCAMPDLTKCPELGVFFAPGNGFTSVDLSKNPKLYGLSLQGNKLTSINIDANQELTSVNLNQNYMDFATLPLIRDSFSEYYYDQYDLEVNKSYKVGDVIDLSKRVLREGTTTGAKMYYTEKEAPTDGIELTEDYYTYENGKITLKKAINKDSYIMFYNNKFEDYPLYTTRFTVKTVADFGQPVKALEFSPIINEGQEIAIALGIEGASEANPKNVYVDFGDGSQYTMKVTEEAPKAANIKGKRKGSAKVQVYVEMDDEVLSYATDGIKYNEFDPSDLTEIKELSIKDAGLYNIDLSYNAKLEKLVLSGNNFKTISLKGKSGYFYKSMLSDIDLSNNALDSIFVDDMYSVKNFNVSNNNLAEFDFSDSDNLITVNASHNKLTEVKFNYSESIKSIDLSYNNISSFYIPEEAAPEYINISNNDFTLTTIPDNCGLDNAHFIYAPQNALKIPTTSPGVDLSEYYNINGKTTTYTWKKVADNSVLTLGTDYTANKGSFKFLSPIFNQKVYCEMTNEAYPNFKGTNIYKTTAVKAIDMPSIEVASFTTTEDGQDVILSLASHKDGGSVYFDWKGDGNVTQYALTTTYTRFSATTKKNTKVRVLIAEEDEQLNIFSISGATMTDLNLEGLKKAFAITVENAGLTEFTLSKSNSLGELNLSANSLTSLDLSRYPNLYYLALSGNKFTTFDLSGAEGLGLAYLGNNALTSVKFNNPNLWSLDLGINKFTSLSFEGAPNIEQLWVNSNQLEDVSPVLTLKKLKVLNVVDNKLSFATLPVNSKWTAYSYGRQADLTAEIKGKVVDLSSQAKVGDTETSFRWFIGKPELNDETGEFDGEELIIDEEYTLVNGVTTFKFENVIEDLVCVLTNEALPNVVLYTKPATFSPDAIKELIANDNISDVKVYSMNGTFVGKTIDTLPAGLYVVNAGDKAYKVLVK